MEHQFFISTQSFKMIIRRALQHRKCLCQDVGSEKKAEHKIASRLRVTLHKIGAHVVMEEYRQQKKRLC